MNTYYVPYCSPLHHAQNYEKYYGLIVLLTEFNEKKNVWLHEMLVK